MRALVGAMVVALSLAATLHAQEPEKRRASSPPPTPAPAAPRARVGTAASPTPPPAPARTNQRAFYYSPNTNLVSGGQYLVLSDGTMLVNFGNGYERRMRSCGQNANAAEAERNATGRDALGRILPPPGIAALQAGSRGTVSGNTPPQNAHACFRHDGRGRAEVMTTGP